MTSNFFRDNNTPQFINTSYNTSRLQISSLQSITILGENQNFILKLNQYHAKYDPLKELNNIQNAFQVHGILKQ